MPQIPVFTAEGKAAVSQFPQRIPTRDFAGGVRVGGRVSAFGEELNRIGAELQKHQNDLDTASLIGEFNGKIKELEVQVRTEVEDPLQRSKEFTKRASELQKELLGTAKNRVVEGEFSQYVGRHLPIITAGVHADALQFMGEQQTAQMQDLGDQVSQQAAIAPTPQDRDELINNFSKIIENNPHLNPLQKQKARKAFVTKSQRDFMEHLGRNDVDRLEELFAKGAFKDVDIGTQDIVMTRARTQRNAALVKAEAALEKQKKDYTEAVEKSFIDRLRDKTLDDEFIDEFSFAISSEKKDLYRKALRDQQLGIKGGNPLVERDFLVRLADPDLNPRNTLRELQSLYRKGAVGYEYLRDNQTHLQAEINRRDNEARAIRNEGDARIRAIQGQRASTALSTAAIAFRTTGGLSLTFDDTASEALVQFRQEFARLELSHGGSRDADELMRELLPKYITQVNSRVVTKVRQLESQLGKYKSSELLKAGRGELSPSEFERLSLAMKELYAIRNEQRRLGALQDTVTSEKSVKEKRFKE